jgi:hypothetical protein
MPNLKSKHFLFGFISWPFFSTSISYKLPCRIFFLVSLFQKYNYILFRSASFRVYLCVVISFFFCCSHSVAKPTLIVDNHKYDAGDQIVEGEVRPIKHEYKITNTGSRKAIVSNILISCSCADIDGPRTIGPGESAVYSAIINLSPGDIDGRSVEFILTFDDPKDFLLKLSFSAKTKFESYALPRSIFFDNAICQTIESKVVYFYFKSYKKLDTFINEVKLEKTNELTAKVLWQKYIDRKDVSGATFYLYSALIQVNLRPIATAAQAEDKLQISFANDKNVILPIFWNAVNNLPFEPKSFCFLLNKETTTATAMVKYNQKAGGLIKGSAVVGEGIKISSIKSYEDYTIFEIQYIRPQKQSNKNKIGKLVIDTIEGKKQEMLLYSDKY